MRTATDKSGTGTERAASRGLERLRRGGQDDSTDQPITKHGNLDALITRCVQWPMGLAPIVHQNAMPLV